MERGDSREVCEQETAEGDHYPLVPAVERGNLRGVCEQEAAEDDHYPPFSPLEKGDSGGVYEQEAAEGGHYPALPRQWRRGTRAGFTNKRPLRMTIIRHFPQ
jgi:hypothetical protein